MTILKCVSATLALFILFTLPVAAQTGAGSSPPGGAPVKDREALGKGKPEDGIRPIIEFLPIWGRTLREQGYNLPLPFGIGLNFIYLDQKTVVQNLQIGVGQAFLPDLRISDVESRDSNITVRGDVWVFPFLNVYGLVGRTSGEADIEVEVPDFTISIPSPIVPGGVLRIDIPSFSIDDTIEYSGLTWGGGATAAAGYKFLFGTVDANYTLSDVLDMNVRTWTVTPRAGMLLGSKKGFGSGAIWLGGMWIDFSQTLTGSFELNEVNPGLGRLLPDGALPYRAELKAKHPWHMLLGGAWEANKRWSIQAELGFLNRTTFMLGGMFRF